MRQVILDTETTGLEHAQGHRVIEIGCVELVNRRATGRSFQRYLNPERDIDVGAAAVHGLTREFLSSQPPFTAVVDELIEFVAGAELVIHNAPFDLGFLDAEMRRLSPARGVFSELCPVLDTLLLARQLHPGQRNSLDALCKRYRIDNSNRDYHGALLDAEILAEVFLAMTGGQGALTLGTEPTSGSGAARPGGQAGVGRAAAMPERAIVAIPIVRATAAELEAHEHSLEAVTKASKGRCLFHEAG